MVKFKHGSVTNPQNGVTKDIIVKSMLPNKIIDALIGGSIVLIGVTYLTVTAFRNGFVKFEAAELEALSDADLLGKI